MKQKTLSIGQRIRAKRLARRVTQNGLANLTGIVQPNLSDIENGKRQPRPGTLAKIAHALGVDATELE